MGHFGDTASSTETTIPLYPSAIVPIRDGIQERVYPARIFEIPFSIRMNPYSSIFNLYGIGQIT
jgi:hypothetical protein